MIVTTLLLTMTIFMSFAILYLGLDRLKKESPKAVKIRDRQRNEDSRRQRNTRY